MGAESMNARCIGCSDFSRIFRVRNELYVGAREETRSLQTILSLSAKSFGTLN